MRFLKERTERGAAIAEFAPALFILLVCALLPVLDLIFDGLAYSSCVSLNNLQLREAVKVPKSQASDPKGTVQLAIPNNWRASLLGWLAPLVQDPTTDVSYDISNGNAYVVVATSLSVNPMITVPFFPNVPGLSAPMLFTVSSNRLIENPRFLNY